MLATDQPPSTSFPLLFDFRQRKIVDHVDRHFRERRLREQQLSEQQCASVPTSRAATDSSNRKGEKETDPPRVLDLGYGAIPNPYFTSRHKVVGLDLNGDFKPPNYTQVVKGDVMDLPKPFEPESFDAITAGELIEHLERPIDFLRGCFHTLKVGGILVITTPNPNSIWERTLTLNMSRRFFYDREHIMLFPQRWLVRIAEMAGFCQVEVFSGGISPPFSTVTLPFPRPWAEYTVLTAKKGLTAKKC